MKSQRVWILILACVALFVVAGWTAQGQKQSPARVQWEYHTVTLKDDLTEARLNELGAQGWELIPMRTEDVDNKVIFYFKRPKQ